MVERGIGERLCHSIYRYAKTNNKYMKDQDKYKGLSYRQYKGVNNSYGRTISQKLAVSNFKRVKVISKFDESFLKSHNEESIKDIFLKLTFNILKDYVTFTIIYHFHPKE